MSFDSLQFRRALGRFATGVCVITANPPGYRPFGLTVNSFASLSLTPPLVLWSLQKTSDTMEAFASPKQYCVNILSQEQKALSGRYAKKGDHAARGFHHWRAGCRCSRTRSRPSSAPWTRATTAVTTSSWSAG
jgi:flavin reductase (DIM6/NTAB) family NADH-FMN oxidoreductase RutF